jgi:hypothetical protein
MESKAFASTQGAWNSLQKSVRAWHPVTGMKIAARKKNPPP